MRALALRRFGASAFSPSSKGGLRETPRDIGSLVLLSLGIVIDCRDYHIYRTAGTHSSRTILGNIYCFSYSYKYAGSGTELPKHLCHISARSLTSNQSSEHGGDRHRCRETRNETRIVLYLGAGRRPPINKHAEKIHRSWSGAVRWHRYDRKRLKTQRGAMRVRRTLCDSSRAKG